MGIFDKLSKSLGLSKKPASTTGERLESSTKELRGGSSSSEFTVTFAEAKLGFQVSESSDTKMTNVTNITKGSAADRAGVLVGDKIIALDGNSISNHEDFLAIFPSFGRPLQVR